VQRIVFEPDSALLLCSDGLSDQVTAADIRRIVERQAGDPDGAVRGLIEAANHAGGKDNVTAVLIEGDRFTARAGEGTNPARTIRASRPAVFLYGLLVALALVWASRGWWQPAAVVIEPRVLTAGMGAQFATIQEALAAARAGDTIEVRGGEYREMVRLKSDVTLRSRLPREAILRAPPVGRGPAVSAEDVRGARMEGFRILADALMPLTVGIVLVNSEVVIDDMEVAGAGVGIEIRGAASPLLRGNAVHDCAGEGILISGLSAPWLSHNAILRNGRAGVAAHDGARPALVGNVFEKNAVELPPEVNMDTVRQMNFFLDAKAGRGGAKR